MKKRYREWLESGKGESEFAHSVGLVRTTFFYRAKKISNGEETSSPGNGFQWQNTGPPFGAGRLLAHIHYPTGVSIELFEGVSAEYLRALITGKKTNFVQINQESLRELVMSGSSGRTFLFPDPTRFVQQKKAVFNVL